MSFLANKIVSVRSESNMEPLNHKANEKQIMQR
jgi:hypothetical protein